MSFAVLFIGKALGKKLLLRRLREKENYKFYIVFWTVRCRCLIITSCTGVVVSSDLSVHVVLFHWRSHYGGKLRRTEWLYGSQSITSLL